MVTLTLYPAANGRIRENMDRYGVVSTELHHVANSIPEDLRPAYVNEAGRVGAMLGLDDARSLNGTLLQRSRLHHDMAGPANQHPYV